VILPPVPAQLFGNLLLDFAAASVAQLRQRTFIWSRLFCIRRTQSPDSTTRLALSRTDVRIMHTASSGRNQPRSRPQLVQPLNPLAIRRVRFLVPSRHPRQLSCIHQQHCFTLKTHLKGRPLIMRRGMGSVVLSKAAQAQPEFLERRFWIAVRLADKPDTI
jgi:hypothetical protein